MVINYKASGSEEGEGESTKSAKELRVKMKDKEEIGNSLAQDEIRNVWVQHYNMEIVIVLCLTKDLKDYPKLLF